MFLNIITNFFHYHQFSFFIYFFIIFNIFIAIVIYIYIYSFLSFFFLFFFFFFLKQAQGPSSIKSLLIAKYKPVYYYYSFHVCASSNETVYFNETVNFKTTKIFIFTKQYHIILSMDKVLNKILYNLYAVCAKLPQRNTIYA